MTTTADRYRQITVPSREFVHTLHIWDRDAPRPKIDWPVVVPVALSCDDDEFVWRAVQLLRIDALHPTGKPALVATIRVPADGVHVVPAELDGPARLLVWDHDLLIPRASSDRSGDLSEQVRWHDERGVRINSQLGAYYADIDTYIGAVSMRAGTGPTPDKHLHHP